MRIAIPCEKERICSSFEKAENFIIYAIDEDKITSKVKWESNGDILRKLQPLDVDAIICGMIEERTKLDLAMSGIEVIAGVYGKTDDVVTKILNNTLDCIPVTFVRGYPKHDAPCWHKGEY